MSEKLFNEGCKEMRSIVNMKDVEEFIDLVRSEAYACDRRACNLELSMESKCLDTATKKSMKSAADEERAMARKWDALCAIFDYAEYQCIKN